MEAQELEDMERLINIFFPFAEEQLVKGGRLDPFAGAITTGGDYVPVAPQQPGETQTVKEAVAALKQAILQQHQGYTVAAVFYATEIEDKAASAPAVAVFIEHKYGNSAYEFVYPYTLDNGENFVVTESFGTTLPKEIFLIW